MVAVTFNQHQAAAINPGASLVIAAAKGDEAAFRSLYEHYARSVYNFVYRSVRDPDLAQDVTQDVWIKVHRDVPNLREAAAFPAWLFRVAAKTCVDAARRRQRRPRLCALAEDIQDRGSGADPESVAMARSQDDLAWESLAALPEHQHMALYLKEVLGRSYREIAQVLDISETAVGLCILRARRGVLKEYERLGQARRDERCLRLRNQLQRFVDREATPVQRVAVQRHLADCQSCRYELHDIEQSSTAYAAIPLLPVPPALTAKVLAATGALAADTGAGLGSTGFLAALSTKAKFTIATFVVASTVAAGAATAPVVIPISTAEQHPSILADASAHPTAKLAPLAPMENGARPSARVPTTRAQAEDRIAELPGGTPAEKQIPGSTPPLVPGLNESTLAELRESIEILAEFVETSIEPVASLIQDEVINPVATVAGDLGLDITVDLERVVPSVDETLPLDLLPGE